MLPCLVLSVPSCFQAAVPSRNTERGRAVDGCATLDRVLERGGLCAVHLLARAGWAEGLAVLLEGGAGADVEDEDGRRPLGMACSGGHEGVVRLLLAQTGVCVCVCVCVFVQTGVTV